MLYPIFEFIFKCSVFLIDVEIIPFKKIIGNIYIRISIVIYIGDCYAEAKADQTSVYTRLFCYIDEMPIIIPV